MKKFCIWMAAALLACNSSQTSDPAKAAASTDSGQPPTHVDTFVWIGTHARWNYSQGVEYDGNYDTVHEVFVVCSSDKHAIVPRSQVVLESSGSCDTAFSNRVRMMLRRPDSNFVKTIGKASSAGISATGLPTVSFNTQQGNRTIQLKQAEATRIKQTSYFRERVLLRPEQLRRPK